MGAQDKINRLVTAVGGTDRAALAAAAGCLALIATLILSGDIRDRLNQFPDAAKRFDPVIALGLSDKPDPVPSDAAMVEIVPVRWP